MLDKLFRSSWRANSGLKAFWVSLVVLAMSALLVSCHSSPTDTSAVQPAPSATKELTSPSIRTHIGFASQQKFDEHFQKHGREFGRISRQEYLHEAQELRDRPADGDVLELVRADGVITRFSRSSGAFLAFDPNGTIRTYFRPNDGINYFRRQAGRPAR